MTVNPGDKISSVDFNTLADAIDNWFSTEWGGSAISDKSVGENILAADFNEMIDRINIGVDIVNNVSGTLSRVSIGSSIKSSEYNDIESKKTSIETNKNDIDIAELSIHAGTTDARTTAWSATIDNGCRYTLSSGAKAGFLFDCGGALLISLALTGGSTGNAINWAALFSAMGTITMDRENTTQSGGGGTGSARGYNDLTTNYQQIFTQSGTGAYTDNEIIINARISASGNYVDIQILCNDDHAGTVDGTTTATFQYKKLDNQSSGSISLIIDGPTSVTIFDTFE